MCVLCCFVPIVVCACACLRICLLFFVVCVVVFCAFEWCVVVCELLRVSV